MEEILQAVASHINKRDKPMIIGISGHGASGKTTFARNLIKLLDHSNLNYINTDPYIIGSQLRKHTTIYYTYQKQNHGDKMTGCHPDAHNWQVLERDLQMVRDQLDFYSLTFDSSEKKIISAKNAITIVEGMTVAFTDSHLYDRMIFLYTNEETELNRRSRRDVSERGTDINYLRESHRERRIQYELFMHPSSQNFDIVIKNWDGGYRVEKMLG
ncbi:uridine kinase [Bacillus sp. JCM 19046]|nr:uridine kinase [Bacillus sp. JCM 19046]